MRGRRCAEVSCARLVDGLAQYTPINIRAQVLAAHSAAGGALDGWATLSGYLADFIAPLADEDR